MQPLIHATALVDPRAQLDSSVAVGAYSIIGPQVKIGSGTRIGPQVVIEGDTTIGRDNQIFQFSSIGAIPQDKKYAGEPTRLEIGDRNLIREFCSFNLGTVQGGGVTRVGNDNWLLAYVHIAHDCSVGNHTIFSNNAQLAGHVQVGDHVVMAGYAGVHQFCNIGAYAMVGMKSGVNQDVPPFVLAFGVPAEARGINAEGMKRSGFSAEQISAVRAAYKLIYKSGFTLEQAKTELLALAAQRPHAADALNLMHGFLDSSTRGIAR